ncbi:MAG: DUF4199 domain-containing protein, partial [Bacteroidota bacterium]|nr:DUF4199 domain-containing protein [Bacteroidota bacterium]
MSDSKNYFIHSAMMHGLFLGLALVLVSVILYLTGNYASKGLGLITYVVLVGGLLWAQYDFRRYQPGGYCPYGKALGYGTVVVLFSSVLTAIYTLVLLAYLDKGLIDQLKTIQEETLLSKGYSPDMVQQQMDMAS